MTQFFGIPIDILTDILAAITLVIIALVVVLALRNPIFFKIGVRNIPRRRFQMVLIVFALMLSTTLLSSVLATGDVLTATVQTVAVYNTGNVDELIEGGHGDLSLYDDYVYHLLQRRAKGDADITAIGAALREQNLLVADQTSRQVRSKVTALAIISGSERGFGGMIDQRTKKQLTISALKKNQVYLNLTTAQLLNARVGDTLYLYSSRWPGQRHAVQVAAIVSNDGLVGDNPFILSQWQTFLDIEGLHDGINQIFVANQGGGGVNGVGLTDTVTEKLNHWIPRDVHVIQVKQQGVDNSQKAQDIFSRIFSLFTLFALAIGLLLIFLIFVLLSAERRAEMGMARAIGVQRGHLVLMYMFEGAIYDLMASFVGLLVGVAVGAALVLILGPILARFDFPLKPTFEPRSLVIAYCLGVIFTFFSVVLSSWLVSRMNVVEALRDLPEPGRSAPSLGELGVRMLHLLSMPARVDSSSETRLDSSGAVDSKTMRRQTRRRRGRILREFVPDILVGFVRALTLLGFVPLLAGLLLMQVGLENTLIIPFSLGFSLIVIGLGLLLKALIERVAWMIARARHKEPEQGYHVQRITNGLFAALVGGVVLAYWALPFDILARLGLPRFQGGIEVFFVAGVMMVLAAAWILITNAGVFVRPLLAFSAVLPGLFATAKLAAAYPLHRRFRMGLSVVMFALVVFAMTVMAIITNAMQNTYVDIDTQTGGYDIQATAYFKSLPDLRTSLAQHGINPNAFSSIGVRDSTAVGMVQLSAKDPRWYIYPAQVVDGGFLQGYGLHLTARADGFNSDNAVWQALQTHPNYALIDSSAVPYNATAVSNAAVYDPSVPSASAAGGPSTPPGFAPGITFSLSGLYQGENKFSAAPVWVVGLQGSTAVKMTIIGVVDNSDSAHYGLYIPRTAYSSPSVGTNLSASNPDIQSYYFKVAPGQDKRALALKLGSAYLDYGLETTVLEDAIWQVRGPRILLSNVLLGVVGMILLLGVAALAITGTRAVIERRQQIGMLRALGCSRRMIQGAFLLESFLVGALGSIMGIVLGLILAKNIFDANFFERYQTGLFFSIPWDQLAIVVGVALLASFLGAVLPSWQAGRIAPAEAIRYQ
jgi:putative ABC transport system permease protein